MEMNMIKLLKKALRSFQEAQQRRADFYILNNLTARELKDMGISRAEIRQKVYGS
jgi:uncharacterized protein YjiS (DUF1127 family)